MMLSVDSLSLGRAASREPTIDEIRREFPDAEVSAANGMCYAKVSGMTVIAAAPDTQQLREQLQEYFDRTRRQRSST